MNELEQRAFGLKVRNKLNGSTARMEPELTERLRVAREAALTRARAAQREPILAGFGHTIAEWGRETWRPLALAAMLALLALGFDHWQTVHRARELEEVDSALLTDELPLDAYLDHGFYRWLQNSEAR
ncbi:MAG: DUF3619 family protein [Rhodocyclaceae bacterium]